MKREDDFSVRRAHLADLSDEQLKERFWGLTEKVVDPLLVLGYENTTPAIERSVLLRMGFSSLEVAQIVTECEERGLLGYGAGHAVYKLAKMKDIDIRAAGLALADGEYWQEVENALKVVN
ncbi:MAG: ornithine aminomutase subunit alpha [Defluviitaleaceae bacterium]|nr:ornithine aminomutase subunit alpha [Defluviitaleaceae bacterium]